MNNEQQSQSNADANVPGVVPQGSVAPLIERMAAAEKESVALVATIRARVEEAGAQCDNIQKRQADAQTAKAEIESQLAAMRETMATFNQQVEAAKVVIAELSTASNQTKESSTQATASLESLRTLANTATEAAGRIEALKTQVEQSAQVAQQRSEHIEDGRKYVDAKRAEIDVILNTAQQSATKAESQHQASRAISDNLTNLYATAQTVKANVDSVADAVRTLRDQCNEYEKSTKLIADIAEVADQRVKAYEMKLVDLESQSRERLKTIDSLLPGAASAGLASAFLNRRGYFKWPQRIWQGVFVLCLILLVIIAGVHTGPNGLEYGLLPKADATLTLDHLWLSLVYRLPFALPLIWLAFHASHKAALSQRLEEDYAFKETVSRSFEGYRREMAELEGKSAPHSALSRLCAGVLAVITNPPGRIYEKHALNKTPFNALAETAAPIAEAATKLKPSRLAE